MNAVIRISSSIIGLGIVTLLACKKDDYKNLDCNAIHAGFKADIEPVIKANCLNSGCHDSGSRHGDFTEYKGIKGKANNGSLEKRVLTKKDMPAGNPLSLDDRKKIKCWLNNGAADN